MKQYYIIEMEEETYINAKSLGLFLCPRDTQELEKAIKNGTPIDKGDLIMFRTLMTKIANKGLPFEEVLLLIDNAQTVESKQDEWIPVSERLPDEYGNYLVFTSDNDIDIGTINPRIENSWSLCDANGFYWARQKGIEITHWKPLPKAPESENK